MDKPYLPQLELVLINRGGLEQIDFSDMGSPMTFKVISLVEHRINDWDQTECPLCKIGSKRIKPKVTEENWRLITTSQN